MYRLPLPRNPMAWQFSYILECRIAGTLSKLVGRYVHPNNVTVEYVINDTGCGLSITVFDGDPFEIETMAGTRFDGYIEDSRSVMAFNEVLRRVGLTDYSIANHERVLNGSHSTAHRFLLAERYR